MATFIANYTFMHELLTTHYTFMHELLTTHHTFMHELLQKKETRHRFSQLDCDNLQ